MSGWRLRTASVLLSLTAVVILGVFVPATFLPGSSAPLGTPVGTPSAVAQGEHPFARPAATSVTLSYSGVDPTAISLSWTESGDYLFGYYAILLASSSNGPWSLIGDVTQINATQELIYDLTPGATYYWEIIDHSDWSGNASSNVLQVSQPSLPTLSFTEPTSTSAQFTWNNPATYGGLLAFSSYDLNESVGGGAYSTAATVTTESSTTYTLNGLSTGTGYSFYVTVVDEYTGGGGYFFYASSNTVTFGTAVALSATALAHPQAVDVGQLVSMTCAAAGGTAPYGYSWAFGDGGTGSGKSVSHTYSAANSYTPTCQVTDAASTTASAPTIVTVSPAPSVAATSNHLAASPGTQLSFSATATGGPGTFTSYSWDFGDGQVGSGMDASHTYSKAGTFNATVTVVDANGGTARGSVSVVISNLSITAGLPRTSGVPGTDFHFTASASGGGGAPYTFAWTFGDGTTGTGSDVTHAYSTHGNYTATVTATDSLGGKNTTTLATVHIYAALTARITLSSSSPAPGSAVNLNASIGGGSGSYTCKWNFGDSNSASGCAVAHSWSTTGTYNITVSVTDPGAGNTTASASVNVQSPSGSGLNLGPSVGGFPILIVLVIVVMVAAILALMALRGRRRPASPARQQAPVAPGAQYCPKCGSPQGAGASFCQKCGQSLGPKPPG